MFDKMKLATAVMDEAVKLLNQAEQLQYAAHLLRGYTGGELAEEVAEPRKKRCGMKLRSGIRRGEWSPVGGKPRRAL